MRYLLNILLLVWCLFGFVLPVEADMVGYWQNQAGQVVEIRGDGYVYQVAENGVVNLAQKVSNLLLTDNKQPVNWEYASAGQGFPSLRQEGVLDRSDWTRDRILDKTLPLSEFKTAVYYRMQSEKNQQEPQKSTSIEPKISVQDSQMTWTSEESSPSNRDSVETETDEEVIRSEEGNQEPEKIDKIDVVVEETAPPKKSSLGQRYHKPSKKSTQSKASTQRGKEDKVVAEELPKTHDATNSFLPACGLLLLIVSFRRTCFFKGH